ncbi:hypothetical protein RV134_380007 [Roseovarius sp. EC-HK134]|uniref:DDE-type integrase/transposase/recombinase n=1 Tax=unclassified Roseovarius TaxID=2614913 RepID=UPI001254C39E|nr:MULTISPECIES: DDE-type integrase/transposase/recombinase [unclassified Roseovarius]VVT33127.1 hypothetical protein RV420_460076 [Roseovarius sp. EC-SD190]VVT33157.1 hypothetical protein RV134_380007 [Roseovarius sp. EC-HK134]
MAGALWKNKNSRNFAFQRFFPDLSGARLLREVRPPRQVQFERQFETPPGQQAQVDFAEFTVEFTDKPGIVRKVWLFSTVLGQSRWLWGQFCPNQTLETVMRSHIAAFDVMGGACTEILYDRMKTAVIGEDAACVVT